MNSYSRLMELAFLAAILVSIYMYPALPNTMVTHWDAQGVANGFSSKEFGLFLIPGIMLAMLIGYRWLVTKKSKAKVGTLPLYPPEIHLFMPGFFIFLLLVHIAVISVNLGWSIPISTWIMGGLGFLFIYLGRLLGRVSPNWLFGIRTPWTLASKAVWNKTHCAGGKLFMYLGVLALITPFLPPWGFLLFVGSVIGISLYLVAYSYWLYQSHK